MRIAGIREVVRGRHHTTTTPRDASAPRHPDLVSRGWDAPEAVDELWVADFSYVWTPGGLRLRRLRRRRLLPPDPRLAGSHLLDEDPAGPRRHPPKLCAPATVAKRALARPGPPAGWSSLRRRVAPPWRSPPSCSKQASPARSAPSATTWTTPCASPPSGCSRPSAINGGGPTWRDRSAVEWQVARWVSLVQHSTTPLLDRLPATDLVRTASPAG